MPTSLPVPCGMAARSDHASRPRFGRRHWNNRDGQDDPERLQQILNDLDTPDLTRELSFSQNGRLVTEASADFQDFLVLTRNKKVRMSAHERLGDRLLEPDRNASRPHCFAGGSRELRYASNSGAALMPGPTPTGEPNSLTFRNCSS